MNEKAASGDSDVVQAPVPGIAWYRVLLHKVNYGAWDYEFESAPYLVYNLVRHVQLLALIVEMSVHLHGNPECLAKDQIILLLQESLPGSHGLWLLIVFQLRYLLRVCGYDRAF